MAAVAAAAAWCVWRRAAAPFAHGRERGREGGREGESPTATDTVLIAGRTDEGDMNGATLRASYEISWRLNDTTFFHNLEMLFMGLFQGRDQFALG